MHTAVLHTVYYIIYSMQCQSLIIIILRVFGESMGLETQASGIQGYSNIQTDGTYIQVTPRPSNGKMV